MGLEQAERYSDFIDAQNPLSGVEVDGFAGLRATFAKWPGAMYGHHIVSLTTEFGIYIVRILHSAMQLSDHL